MTDNKIYFISQDIYSEEDSEEFWKNMKIFTNLKDALDELDQIYNNTPDFKWSGYCVRTLTKIDNKYVNSHETYYHQKGYS